MYKESFHQKLKQARIDAGYSQKTIEQQLKINRSVLSRYETGALEPNIETLGILADFYEVSTDWLIGTKGENKRKDK